MHGRGGVLAEVGLDRREVVPEDGVGRSERDGGPRRGDGVGRSAGLVQRPRERVVSIHRRPGSNRARGEVHGRGRARSGIAGMVGLEAGQIQVDGDAVRRVQLLDGADDVVLTGGVVGSAGSRVGVAERGHDLGQGEPSGERFEERDRGDEVTASGGGAAEAELGRDIACRDRRTSR